MAVSESQLRATRNYNRRNPERTAYNVLIRTAKRLVNYDPESKTADAINWAIENDKYKNDLLELQELLQAKLKELDK